MGNVLIITCRATKEPLERKLKKTGYVLENLSIEVLFSEDFGEPNTAFRVRQKGAEEIKNGRKFAYWH